MKLIERPQYLNRLKNVIGTPDIKVITGVRRSGKSKLLQSFIEYLNKTDTNKNIIHIDYNLTINECLMEYHKLEEFIENHYNCCKNNYVIIDEIQMCYGFEKAINSIHAQEKYDIYITGSNAFLLSSDLATLFTGRTFEIEVFPFSFIEYKKYYGLLDNYPSFDNYLKEGGMAGSYVYSNPKDKSNYIKSVYNTLIVKDIKRKYKIKNTILLDRITEFLIDNISNITSNRNIAEILTKNNDLINHKTVGSYIEYLCNAFLFYKIKRYDIKGKKYLSSSDKYFIIDTGFRYSVIGNKNADTGRTLENIVAIELLRRGYEVYIGLLHKKEIDFIAIKSGEKIYIQVSDDITNKNTFERETTSLLKINDAYPKMIIARTRSERYKYEGIEIIDIAEWLTEDVLND